VTDLLLRHVTKVQWQIKNARCRIKNTKSKNHFNHFLKIYQVKSNMEIPLQCMAELLSFFQVKIHIGAARLPPKQIRLRYLEAVSARLRKRGEASQNIDDTCFSDRTFKASQSAILRLKAEVDC
jgi:hypothetical protein